MVVILPSNNRTNKEKIDLAVSHSLDEVILI